MKTASALFRQRLTRLPILALLLAALLTLSSRAEPRVQSMPPALPASYWGTLTINGSFASAGTWLTIGNGGVVYATAYSTIHEGIAYYQLNVPEDNPDTPQRDGGQPGEVLEIMVAGLDADQTVVWQSGLHQRVDLTASGATPTPSQMPTLAPTATPTPIPTGPAYITGAVTLQGRGAAPSASWQVPLQVSVHLPGNPMPAYQFQVETDAQGRFAVADAIPTGTYDVGVRSLHSLRNLRVAQTLAAPSTHLEMGTLVEGDANLDGRIDILDFSLLAACYGARTGDASYNSRVDFNDDGVINILDFSLLAANYGLQGDRIVGSGASL